MRWSKSVKFCFTTLSTQSQTGRKVWLCPKNTVQTQIYSIFLLEEDNQRKKPLLAEGKAAHKPLLEGKEAHKPLLEGKAAHKPLLGEGGKEAYKHDFIFFTSRKSTLSFEKNNKQLPTKFPFDLRTRFHTIIQKLRNWEKKRKYTSCKW